MRYEFTPENAVGEMVCIFDSGQYVTRTVGRVYKSTLHRTLAYLIEDDFGVGGLWELEHLNQQYVHNRFLPLSLFSEKEQFIIKLSGILPAWVEAYRG